MSEKLKPCPLCGGDGIECEWGGVSCANRDAGECLGCIAKALWQAIPRVDIDAIREVVGEMVKYANRDASRERAVLLGPGFGVAHASNKISDWHSRLESALKGEEVNP